MAHFTLQVGPGGPLLTAYVGVSGARQQALRDQHLPVPSAVQIIALVDTGASCTCIDPTVFERLELTPTGSISVLTPSTGATPHQAAQYDVSLQIPASGPNHVPLTIPTLQVTASELAVQGIHALIGRDILAACLLTYNGTVGQFTLAF